MRAQVVRNQARELVGSPDDKSLCYSTSNYTTGTMDQETLFQLLRLLSTDAPLESGDNISSANFAHFVWSISGGEQDLQLMSDGSPYFRGVHHVMAN